MPLSTTEKRSSQPASGCALASDGRPCVAQRVCPMPVVAGEPFVPATCLSTLRLPTARTTSSPSPSISEMPAES